jgi:hypothetical protein
MEQPVTAVYDANILPLAPVRDLFIHRGPFKGGIPAPI